MKKIINYSLVCIVQLSFIDSIAQCNLVHNASFEIDNNCVNGSAGIEQGYSPPWDSPTLGTSDLFNSCSQISGGSVPFNNGGFQNAHSGVGYCNILTYQSSGFNWREYIQIEMDSALVSNREYCVSFYVNLIDSASKSTNNIGLYFSTTHIFFNTNQYLNFIPQINYTTVISDTADWTEISGVYNALGGERYIIIGNFFTDSMTNIVPQSGPYDMGYYFVDDVDIHLCTCNVGVAELTNEMYFKFSPNPNNGVMQLNYSLADNETGVLRIFDMIGKQIREYKLIQGSTILNINEQELNNGIYLYKVIVNEKLVKSDKLVIVK